MWILCITLHNWPGGHLFYNSGITFFCILYIFIIFMLYLVIYHMRVVPDRHSQLYIPAPSTHGGKKRLTGKKEYVTIRLILRFR